MILKKGLWFSGILTLLLAGNLFAQETADAISAKAFLEEVLVKRYSQNISTFVDKDAYSVGAQVELTDVEAKPELNPDDQPAEETPMDLMVGTLDTEKIMKQYALDAEKPALASYLATKKIKSVFVSVGLKEDLGELVKNEVSKWLTERVQKEFGNLGTTDVKFVKVLPTVKETEKTKQWWDWLDQFQNLASVALLALALLFGVFFWRLTTSKLFSTTQNNSEAPQIKLSSDGKPLGPDGQGASVVKNAEEERKLAEEYFILAQKVSTIAVKITGEMENLVRTWSNSGDEGKLKIVCFAEAVGKEVGRLPIPPDTIQDVAKVFTKMSKTPLAEKLEILDKVYWDLMTVLNLGTDVLAQPFSYLAGTDSELLSQILMDQNPKLKTLVSHYLPDDVRKKYVNSLNESDKLEILKNAASLKNISFDELKTHEQNVMNKLDPSSSDTSVVIDMAFEKLVDALSIFEELQLLPQIQGDEILQFKRKTPSLAYLPEWPDESLSFVVSKLRPDQIVAYLRLKPEMKDRIIGLCPEMTAEVVTDDLNQPDRFSDSEKEKLLRSFADTLLLMHQQKEINLENIFAASSSKRENNVVNIKSA